MQHSVPVIKSTVLQDIETASEISACTFTYGAAIRCQRSRRTHDALEQHVKRANYQAAVWQRALQPAPATPSPHGHGWIFDGSDGLQICWMIQPATPQEVLKTTSCKCRGGCTTARCSCRYLSLPCTDACGCKNCEDAAEARLDLHFANDPELDSEGGSDVESGN